MSAGELSAPVSCRGCGAPIRLILLTSGEWMPVEATPTETWLDVTTRSGAGVVTLVDAEGRQRRGLVLPGPLLIGGDELVRGWEPHWSRCPEAARFRKRRPRGGP